MAGLKGLVLETGDNWALILSERGEYKRIKTKQLLQVGEIWQEPAGHLIKYAVAAAICLVLLGSYSYFPVVAYAQISSGIELGINRWERVVSVRPLDANGTKLLQEVKLQGRTIEQAVEILVDKTVSDGAEKKEMVLKVVPRKPGYEQIEKHIMNKMDNKVKLISPDNVEIKKNVEKGHPGIIKNIPSKDGIDFTKPMQKNPNNKTSENKPGKELHEIKDQREQKIDVDIETKEKENAQKINVDPEKKKDPGMEKANAKALRKEYKSDADKSYDKVKDTGEEKSEKKKKTPLKEI